jgi:hypothetical protein
LGAARSTTCVLLFLLLCTLTVIPAHATTQPSIPITGRYSELTIKIFIPSSPQWAYDVVLNATNAWNQAQLWYLQNTPSATAYTFVETNDGTATSAVSFSMPAEFASIAVGWTSYKFAAGSRTSITSTQTYLTPRIFNDAGASNATARRYAFWLALHELGRILGLGSVLDGKDIMEPRYTPERVSGTPMLSTLDLYAVHVLAEGQAPTFVTLPYGVQDQLVLATSFLPNAHEILLAPMPASNQLASGTQVPSQFSGARSFGRLLRFIFPL